MIGNLIKSFGRCGFLKQKIKINGEKFGYLFVNNTQMRFSQTVISKNMMGQENNDFNQSITQQHLYTQRAYTPSQMSNQLLDQLSHIKHSPQQILHQLSLYYNKLIPFDYDYFTESLRRLIHYQQKLSMDEILMLFDLAIEYKIDSLVLQRQFMNEIYCRVYLGMKKELLEYDNKMQEQLDVTYQALELMSKDHFQIIDEKFKELLQQQNEDGEKDESGQNTQRQPTLTTKQKLKNKPIYNAGSRKNKSKKISPQILNRITKIFINSNCKNVEFNKLLLEIHTTRIDENALVEKVNDKEEQKMTAENLLFYTRLTVNLLQLYMTEYQSTLAVSKNKENKYTHRSVKNIYKLQHFYYYEVAKMVEQQLLLSKATNDQLLQFVNVLSAFPIKRRSFRKTVGEIMIEEFKKRQLQIENMMRFFELSRHDNKLLQHFQNKINHGKQLIQTQDIVDQQSQVNKQENSSSNTLTADVIIDQQLPQTEHSTLFKMPLSLFKKVTKKKSKPKNKKLQQNEIDLTQPDEQINIQVNSQLKAQKQFKQQNVQ